MYLINVLKMKPTSVKLSESDRAFLTSHHMKLSDVVHYGILQLKRVVPERGYPLCIYLDIQSRTARHTVRNDSALKDLPRTCAGICGSARPDPAALSMIDAAESPGQKENII